MATMRSPVRSPALIAGESRSTGTTMRLSGERIVKPVHATTANTSTAKARLASGPAATIAIRRQGLAAKKAPGSVMAGVQSSPAAPRSTSSPRILQ